jgi:glycoside/pentoside/hexuronide:cation symporter, GPH family
MSVNLVSRPVRFGYGLGSFCTGTFGTVPGLLLLYYLTNVLGVRAVIAGPAVFVPKAWDLFINPWVGRLSDATRSRHGPRRPWLLAGAATLPVCFALTFAGPGLTGTWAGLYVGVAFLLASTAYALFEVPYKAMPAEMTSDYHEASALLAWRMVFLGAAILISGALAPGIADAVGGVGGYRVMGLVMAAVLAVSMVATFTGTRKAPRAGRGQAEPSLRAQLAVIRTNRTFGWLLGFSCAQMLAAGLLLAGAPYFATYTLHDPNAVTPLFLCLVGPILVTMPVWKAISRRVEKRGAMVAASALFLAGSVALGATAALGAPYAYGCVLAIGVGYAGLQLLQYSMLADTIVADELRSGKRRAGMFTGIWTAAETVIFALGAFVLAALLALAGYVSTDLKHPVSQPHRALEVLQWGAPLIAGVFMAASIAATVRYDLDGARMARLRAASGELEPAGAGRGDRPSG